jgi:DNA uptake protein ComE-like DNA-binding protein
VITYREREDGFSSLDDLDHVPGMARPFLKEVKSKLTL